MKQPSHSGTVFPGAPSPSASEADIAYRLTRDLHPMMKEAICPVFLLREASSEIERLRAENERSELGRHRLGEALKVAEARAASAEAERDEAKEQAQSYLAMYRQACEWRDSKIAEIEAQRDALAAKLAAMDAALEGSTAMRCSTGENYSVAVYFVDLARAQEFHGFIAERCAEIRRAREARTCPHGENDG